MTYEHILVEDDGSITDVTMNRPERRNALSEAHMGELIDALRAAGARRETRAVILSGNGPAFSAGHDLREMLDRDLDDLSAPLRPLRRADDHGAGDPAAGDRAGRTASPPPPAASSPPPAIWSSPAQAARFATPGVNIGLFCTTPMVALTRAIGRKRAMQMLLTGEAIDAHTAAEWGLVNRVVPAAELAAATRALAESIAAASSLTVAIGKQAFYAQIDLDQPKAYAYAKEVMA